MDDATTALIAGAAAILGGVLGGLLSGAYQHGRDYYERPILEVDCQDTNANRVDADTDIYVRARVRNVGRRLAKNTLVFLMAIYEVYPSGPKATPFVDPMPLSWAFWSFEPRHLPKDIPFYVDILKISKGTPGWNLRVEHTFANYEKLRDYSGIFRFVLMATAEDALPTTCTVDINYEQDPNTLRIVSSSSRSRG